MYILETYIIQIMIESLTDLFVHVAAYVVVTVFVGSLLGNRMAKILFLQLEEIEDEVKEKFTETLVYGTPIIIMYLTFDYFTTQVLEFPSSDVINMIQFVLLFSVIAITGRTIYLSYMHYSK